MFELIHKKDYLEPDFWMGFDKNSSEEEKEKLQQFLNSTEKFAPKNFKGVYGGYDEFDINLRLVRKKGKLIMKVVAYGKDANELISDWQMNGPIYEDDNVAWSVCSDGVDKDILENMTYTVTREYEFKAKTAVDFAKEFADLLSSVEDEITNLNEHNSGIIGGYYSEKIENTRNHNYELECRLRDFESLMEESSTGEALKAICDNKMDTWGPIPFGEGCSFMAKGGRQEDEDGCSHWLQFVVNTPDGSLDEDFSDYIEDCIVENKEGITFDTREFCNIIADWCANWNLMASPDN